jgi:hypothetical protein
VNDYSSYLKARRTLTPKLPGFALTELGADSQGDIFLISPVQFPVIPNQFSLFPDAANFLNQWNESTAKATVRKVFN